MLRLTFDDTVRAPQRILCLGAHSDDIEIGCGGSILRLAQEHPHLHFCWVVLSATGERIEEAKASAQSFLHGVDNVQIIVKGFRDGHFPYDGAELKAYFEELKAFEPDLIFTHCRHDLHQDHRVTAELTWNTFRDHFILEYEIPKYDGDLQSPNFFIYLPASIRQQKVDLLMQHFATQANRHWFTPDTFNAIMRIRGVESRAPELYAEGFYCRKLGM